MRTLQPRERQRKRGVEIQCAIARTSGIGIQPVEHHPPAFRACRDAIQRIELLGAPQFPHGLVAPPLRDNRPCLTTGAPWRWNCRSHSNAGIPAPHATSPGCNTARHTRATQRLAAHMRHGVVRRPVSRRPGGEHGDDVRLLHRRGELDRARESLGRESLPELRREDLHDLLSPERFVARHEHLGSVHRRGVLAPACRRRRAWTAAGRGSRPSSGGKRAGKGSASYARAK